MPTVQEKRRTFRALHEAGCFVIPNPWDVGSARYLQSLGFKALATTSAGLAFALGRPDAHWAVSRAETLDHIRMLVDATDVPVNADFESGFADDPDGVGESVRFCVETGVAGLSIEDLASDGSIYPLEAAVARIAAARRAIDAAKADVVLVARAEASVSDAGALRDVVARLVAFAEAGADCLYAPTAKTGEQISAIVQAVAPKPVNVLAGSAASLPPAELAALGVRRVSLGAALARAAWSGFMAVAKELATSGTLTSLGSAASYAELNAFFVDDQKRKPA